MKTSTNNPVQIFDLVQDQVFKQIKPIPKPNVQPRFTTTQSQESMPPESGELGLSQYEEEP